MPITTRFDIEHNIIEHVCTGVVGMEDIVHAFDAALEHESFVVGMNVLWDLSGARIDATPDQMQGLVTHVGLLRQQRGSNYCLAIVANDTILRMLADIFKALSSPLSFEVGVYKNHQSAIDWLDSAGKR